MLRDLARGWRSWRHAKGIALLSMVALAVGIAATTAIYTVIQAVLLNPLPYEGATRCSLTALNGGWPAPNSTTT